MVVMAPAQRHQLQQVGERRALGRRQGWRWRRLHQISPEYTLEAITASPPSLYLYAAVYIVLYIAARPKGVRGFPLARAREL